MKRITRGFIFQEKSKVQNTDYDSVFNDMVKLHHRGVGYFNIIIFLFDTGCHYVCIF